MGQLSKFLHFVYLCQKLIHNTKKKTAIFLLCLCSFYFLFSSIGTLIEQQLHYQAQLHCLSPTAFDAVFTLSVAAFQEATVKKQELFLNGKLYDITHLEYADTSIIVHAKQDSYEENLLQQLVEYCKKYPVQHFSSLLKKVIDTLFLIVLKIDLNDFCFYPTSGNSFFIQNKKLFSCFLILFSPPPEKNLSYFFEYKERG